MQNACGLIERFGLLAQTRRPNLSGEVSSLLFNVFGMDNSNLDSCQWPHWFRTPLFYPVHPLCLLTAYSAHQNLSHFDGLPPLLIAWLVDFVWLTASKPHQSSMMEVTPCNTRRWPPNFKLQSCASVQAIAKALDLSRLAFSTQYG